MYVTSQNETPTDKAPPHDDHFLFSRKSTGHCPATQIFRKIYKITVKYEFLTEKRRKFVTLLLSRVLTLLPSTTNTQGEPQLSPNN